MSRPVRSLGWSVFGRIGLLRSWDVRIGHVHDASVSRGGSELHHQRRLLHRSDVYLGHVHSASVSRRWNDLHRGLRLLLAAHVHERTMPDGVSLHGQRMHG